LYGDHLVSAGALCAVSSVDIGVNYWNPVVVI